MIHMVDSPEDRRDNRSSTPTPDPTPSVVRSGSRWQTPLLIGTPTLGKVRIEWANALNHMVLPVNLSLVSTQMPYYYFAPLFYHVAEAQNLIVREALEPGKPYEWILFIEDDVVVPPTILLQLAKWMHDGRFPVVSGWYNVKSVPPQPMFFRGRGNGPLCHSPAEVDQYVEPINPDLHLRGILCDGVPTGCLLVSVKLLRVAWEDSPPLTVTRVGREDGSIFQLQTREIFRTTREAGIDPMTGGYYKRLGTSDLEFCDRAIDRGWLKAAGFSDAALLEFPYPVDTDIRCGHIDLSSGVIY